MLEEGYAAASSRRVAERAGVNNGLIHYYFGTMDQMFIELFRRAADQGIEPTIDPASSDQPLWDMWEQMRHFSGNALMTEFIALANHRDAIRGEIAEYSERLRTAQVQALTRILQQYGIDEADASPGALAVLMVGLTRFLQMEAAFGITVGHDELVRAVEQRIRAVEGDRRPAGHR